MMYGFSHMWGMGWGWMIGLFLLIAVIWLIVRMANQPVPPQFPRENRALDLLKERYAKGEISKEEFEEKKKDII